MPEAPEPGIKEAVKCTIFLFPLWDLFLEADTAAHRSIIVRMSAIPSSPLAPEHFLHPRESYWTLMRKDLPSPPLPYLDLGKREGHLK